MATYGGHIPLSEEAKAAAALAQTQAPYQDLATRTNTFMSGQALAPFLQNLPNYANMVGKRTENITSNLAGQLPQDVINQIGIGAAERGIAGGMTGGPNSNSAYLRALGLNSLQLQNQGSQDLSAAIRDTPTPEIWNPMSLYVPQTIANQELEQARAASANQPTLYPSNFANGGGGGGGVSYTGATSGMGRTAPIQRTRNEGTVMGGALPGATPQISFGSQLPQSSYDNWWDTYGSSGGGDSRSTSGGNLDQMIDGLTSAMSGLPEFLGGGDWWNQPAQAGPQQPQNDGYDFGFDFSNDDYSDLGFDNYWE